ncbi:MAG: hypothetical protein R3F17_08015 [Planctomycetota bacterium]
MFRDWDNFSEGGWALSGVNTQMTGGGLEIYGHPVRCTMSSSGTFDTGDTNTLLDHRAFISRVWFVQSVYEGSRETRAVLFAVTETDTSGDGELDNLDATVVWMTDAEGRNGQVVTPADGQLDSIHLYGEAERLIFMVRMDTDGDHKYKDGEPLVPYTAGLGAGEKQVERWLEVPVVDAVKTLYR